MPIMGLANLAGKWNLSVFLQSFGKSLLLNEVC
jgi:hypothetical protein